MPATSASLRRARPLLGTYVEIHVDDARPHGAEQAVEAAFAAVAEVHRLMSVYDPESDVSRLNREACRRAVEVHPWTTKVLQAAVDMARLSDGAFDIGVSSRARQPIVEKEDSAIELLAGDRVRFHRAEYKIDLGGIAKGFAVDCAIAALRTYDIAAAMVNAGGDLAAFGPRARVVDIRDPRSPCGIVCQLELRDKAMASSARRFDPFRSVETTDTAVVNPATGRPAQNIHGATVCAPTCMVADALTKIVMISGEAAAGQLSRFGASAMLVAANGDILTTPDWQGDLQHAA
ncbi:FAD:protein FMN transferase [Bradyrhizobium sp. HKCCYLR20261]|uniref:FAD:protein FMN transferase n=1 Tax=Bradyrhizobium sp. HKCCYLR20261 TaxID=3420760 RepID=UPI003EBDC96A